MRKKYRPCVGACLVNQQGHIFVGRRVDQMDPIFSIWQMPQGGIEENETPYDAVVREIQEEIGLKSHHYQFILEKEEWVSYDFPKNLAKTVFNGTFAGQTQRWFLFYFQGQDDNIVLDYKEFNGWRWIKPKDLLMLNLAFKRKTYENVYQSFQYYLKPFR